jgi:hypothetical protein
MKSAFIAVLILAASTSRAEVFRCPPTYLDQNYPVKNLPNAPLTGAEIMFGERPSSGPPYPDGWLTPEEIPKEGGMNFRYGLSEDDKAWLICTYGARKRIKGRLHGNKEWGQHMESGQPWFMRLPAKVKECTVQVRESGNPDPNETIWMVTTICRRD